MSSISAHPPLLAPPCKSHWLCGPTETAPELERQRPGTKDDGEDRLGDASQLSAVGPEKESAARERSNHDQVRREAIANNNLNRFSSPVDVPVIYADRRLRLAAALQLTPLPVLSRPLVYLSTARPSTDGEKSQGNEQRRFPCAPAAAESPLPRSTCQPASP